MKLLGNYWKYINEGNAHIVVQLLDTNYVLRLIKEDERTDPKSVYDHVNFVNLIMIPLLGNKFYGKEEAIEMSQYDLELLSKMLLPYRPQNRIFKSVLSQIAIKATNLSIVSSQCDTNYCIEIKPKEGFMSSSLRKYSTCYYCLKQHLKLQTGTIRQTSNYCPLDLFSGERERMKLSLLNMINNAQNNFKIFKNGLLKYDEKCEQSDFEYILKDMDYFSDLNQFLNFIIDILLSDINEPYIQLQKTKNICMNDKPSQCYESNNLKNNSFLYKLLQLQKMSDSYLFNVENERNEHSNYVSKLIEQLETLGLDLTRENDRETFLKTTNPIHLALISAVAKDCSIMISFSTNFVENYPYVDTGDSKIFYKLAVTDLEPKSPNTLYKRRDTEKKMIEIYEKYKESLEKEQQCKYINRSGRNLNMFNSIIMFSLLQMWLKHSLFVNKILSST